MITGYDRFVKSPTFPVYVRMREEILFELYEMEKRGEISPGNRVRIVNLLFGEPVTFGEMVIS